MQQKITVYAKKLVDTEKVSLKYDILIS